MADLEQLKERAVWLYLNTPYCCAECVFKALLEYFNYPHDESLIRAAAGFGGGIGSSGCACGTLAGSAMSIGLIMERNCPNQDGKKIKAVTHKVFQHFKGNYKVPCCRLLTRETKDNEALKKQACSLYVGEITAFTATCLQEEENNNS